MVTCLCFIYGLFLQKRVLVALEEAGVFTSGGLVKDKVCQYAPIIIDIYSCWNLAIFLSGITKHFLSMPMFKILASFFMIKKWLSYEGYMLHVDKSIRIIPLPMLHPTII